VAAASVGFGHPNKAVARKAGVQWRVRLTCMAVVAIMIHIDSSVEEHPAILSQLFFDAIVYLAVNATQRHVDRTWAATVSACARSFAIMLPAVIKHLNVLQ